MNASHLFAGIYWPVMLMVLATGGFSCPGVVPTARAAQIHAAAAPLPDPVLQGDESSTRMKRRPSIQSGAFRSVSYRHYASTNIGRGGQFAVSDVGIFKFDGVGTFSGSVTVNLPTGLPRGCRTSSRRLPEHMR